MVCYRHPTISNGIYKRRCTRICEERHNSVRKFAAQNKYRKQEPTHWLYTA